MGKLSSSPPPALPLEPPGLLESTQEAVTEREEKRHIGHVEWSVYGFYTASVGPLLTITILVSLLMMQVCASPDRRRGWSSVCTAVNRNLRTRVWCEQASRNGSDIWLSLWVSRATPEQLRGISGSGEFLAGAEAVAPTSSAAVGSLRVPILQIADWWREGHAAEGWQAPLGVRRQAAVGHNGSLAEIHLPEGVTFYLSILLMFAACNSLFTLIR